MRPTFHTHDGLAVVNKGFGMHMPDEPKDCPVEEPLIDAQGAAFWAFAALFGALIFFAVIGVSASAYYFLRG